MGVVSLRIIVYDANQVPVNKAKVELTKRTLVATSTTDDKGVALFRLDAKLERTTVTVWVNGKTTQNILVADDKTFTVTYLK